MAEQQRLSGTEKAAVLVLTLGEEAAQEIMQLLPPHMLQRITKYSSMLREVPPDVIETIKKEFIETMRKANVLELGNSRDAMRSIMGNFMSEQDVEKLTLDLEGESDMQEGLEALKWMAPETISAFIRNEHPQTIALLLAHLEPVQAAQVLQRVKPSMQAEVIMRLSTLERVAPRVLQDLNQVLKEELISSGATTSEVMGGPASAAEIMNNIDKSSETNIFESVEELNPSLVEEIRELMFTFEDLVNIDNRGMQELTKSISNEQLVLALKTASDEIKEKFFGNISSRAAELIKEELEVMGPVKLSDVEVAQMEIVKIARRLEEEGKVVLGGGGDSLV